MSDLQATYGEFLVKGRIVGLNAENSITTGLHKNGEWKRLQFGIQISENSIIPISLFANKMEEIKAYPRKRLKEGFDKIEPIMVSWDSRYDPKYEHLKIPQAVRLNIDNSVLDSHLMAWDAIEEILKFLHNGLFVVIKGRNVIENYQEQYSMNYNIKEIYLEEVENCQALFSQQIVYAGIVNDQSVNARIISRTKNGFDVTPYEFKVTDKKILHYLKERVTIGTVLRVHGEIVYKVPIDVTQNGLIVTGPRIDELKIQGGRVDKDREIVYDIKQIDEMIHKDKVETENESETNEFGF